MGVHNCQNTQDRLPELKSEANKQYKVSLLNSVMPVLIEEMDKFCKANGVYSSTAGSSSLYSDYQNNQVGSSEGSTSFRIPETGSNFQSSGESYVTTV